jgi:modulator of FtsH protease HflC
VPGRLARGDGDADRARIFAQAYGKDPEFYAFYRSMQAYEAALQPSKTRLVLPPDSPVSSAFSAAHRPRRARNTRSAFDRR